MIVSYLFSHTWLLRRRAIEHSDIYRLTFSYCLNHFFIYIDSTIKNCFKAGKHNVGNYSKCIGLLFDACGRTWNNPTSTWFDLGERVRDGRVVVQIGPAVAMVLLGNHCYRRFSKSEHTLPSIPSKIIFHT